MISTRVRRIGLVVLVVTISMSPRIPLGIAIPDRRFDLRVEDIILTVLLLSWLLHLFLRSRIYPTPLFKAIGIYVMIVFFTTSIAMMTLDLNLIRSFFYFLKEIEYFLIFFLIANWIRSEADLKLMSGFLLFSGLLNAIWVGFQFITSQYRPLFLVERELPSYVYQHPTLLESYGPNLIGEASPLATGGLFMLVFLLALNFLLFDKSNNRKWLYVILSVVFSACMVLSFSRASMIAAGIGVATILTKVNIKKKLKVTFVLTIALFVGLIVINHIGYFGATGRLSFMGLKNRFHEQVFEIWQPLIYQGHNRFLIGFGKGALGFIKGIDATEAHNHYLRVFIESGFLGLLTFVCLLAMIVSLSARVLKEGKLAISKVIGGATLSATVGLGIGALFQDIFTPVILNELWWVLVGLTAAAYRIECNFKNEGKMEIS